MEGEGWRDGWMVGQRDVGWRGGRMKGWID